MTKDIAIADEVPFLGADWFDPLEAGIRQHIRGFIENLAGRRACRNFAARPV
jgi:hypothetical protein